MQTEDGIGSEGQLTLELVNIDALQYLELFFEHLLVLLW